MALSRERQRVLLARPCHYDLPNDLVFEGLARSQGAELVRLRFSRRRGTEMDLPLKAEALSALVRQVSHLHGFPPETIGAELTDLMNKGIEILE